MPLLSFFHYSCIAFIYSYYFNSYYPIRITVTCFLTLQHLPPMCQICSFCCESLFVFQWNSVSVQRARTAFVSVSLIYFWIWNGRHPRLFFFRPVAPTQHPDLNPVNCKISIEFQQWVCLRKIHNANRPTLWYGWHGSEQRIINNAIHSSGVNVCEYVFV